MRFLFLLFVIIPIVEITLLINVGQAIGAWYTIALVLVSAFVGVNMLRHQGLATLTRARSRMDSGELPAQEMVEGLVLAVGGALLITPGFVTDVMGFCCLIPLTRRALVKPLLSRFAVTAARQAGATFTQNASSASDPSAVEAGQTERAFKSDQARRPDGSKGGQIIEGEYRQDD
ncbi:MAG: UPF0716 protein FxsA [Motiliproteus sp.]|jgi:UPF0716 protein FxsA